MKPIDPALLFLQDYFHLFAHQVGNRNCGVEIRTDDGAKLLVLTPRGEMETNSAFFNRLAKLIPEPDIRRDPSAPGVILVDGAAGDIARRVQQADSDWRKKLPHVQDPAHISEIISRSDRVVARFKHGLHRWMPGMSKF